MFIGIQLLAQIYVKQLNLSQSWYSVERAITTPSVKEEKTETKHQQGFNDADDTCSGTKGKPKNNFVRQ